jgi:hypothetical protein
MRKHDINALASHAPIRNPSELLMFAQASLHFAVKRMLPLANPLKLTKPHVQRAYGSSDSPENDYERLLFDLNVLLPVTALLRIGPYVVPLLVMRFVIDKTGRFLALVTCPWSASHDVFSVFHFFKNMLHMLHQMDKDDRLSLLRDFGESQVFHSQQQHQQQHMHSARCMRTSSLCWVARATSSRTRGRMSTLAIYGLSLSLSLSQKQCRDRTSHRKLTPGDSAELIAKLRQSDFWTALNANSLGPNAINNMSWSTQMISELTSAKNAFGHQARDGVCEDGDLNLCVCHTLMERLFEHAKDPKFDSAGALLRLVAANIPSGMVYNFRHYAAQVSAAVRALYAAHPKLLQPLEMLRERKRKAKPEPIKKEPQVQACKDTCKEAYKDHSKEACKEEDNFEDNGTNQDACKDAFKETFKETCKETFKGPCKEEPCIKQELPILECPDFKRRAFYSASFRVTRSTYSADCVKRVEAGIKIGGVDPRDLITAINAIFA